MVLKGANILSHMGDYPSRPRPLWKKERKEKAGETLIDTWCASQTEETAPGQKQPKKCENNNAHKVGRMYQEVKTI